MRSPKVQRSNPKLWASIVKQVKQENIGGTSSGEWSARKAQIAVKRYKDRGGRYIGRKSKSNSLVRWGAQKWRTKSGRPSHITGERYLPEKAIKALSAEEYAATSRAKRKSMRLGQQYSSQPSKIAKKVRKYRT